MATAEMMIGPSIFASGIQRSQAAVARFEAIDVLVNNVDTFHAGIFKEITPKDVWAQVGNTLRPTQATQPLPCPRSGKATLTVVWMRDLCPSRHEDARVIHRL
jgi:hypothetical protein